MFDPIDIALIILALPLCAALLAWICCASSDDQEGRARPADRRVRGGGLLAFTLLRRGSAVDAPQLVSKSVTWFAAGNFKVHYTVAVDSLTAIMLGMITFIATFIAVFSGGYMHGDNGFPRFFAVMSLFVFSMCGLVLANNFLLLVAFWEGVGLSLVPARRLLLREAAARAAARGRRSSSRGSATPGFCSASSSCGRSARLAHRPQPAVRAHREEPARPGPADRRRACCCSAGAVGKSASSRCTCWLPDAMEGPTPVSALIHAATMVTAGVYLLARCSPLFAMAPARRLLVAWIGGITALLAAFIALRCRPTSSGCWRTPPSASSGSCSWRLGTAGAM